MVAGHYISINSIGIYFHFLFSCRGLRYVGARFFARRRNMADLEKKIISDPKPSDRWIDTRGGNVVVEGELSSKVKIGKLSE